MRAATCVLVVALAACGNKGQPTRVPPPAPAGPSTPTASSVPISPGLLRDLSILTTKSEPSEALKLLASQNDIDGVVSMLVDDRRFTNEVVPTMLLEDMRFTTIVAVSSASPRGLKPGKDPSDPLYLTKPCKPTDATKVEPWWALGTEVLVCNDAYRPDVLVGESLPGRSGPGPKCSSAYRALHPEWGKGCGCGRNLVNCVLDNLPRDHRDHPRQRMKASFTNEILDTVGYVVSSGAPIQSIYLGTETVRDRLAEITYRKHDIAQGNSWKAGLDAFDKPVWAPRKEDFPGMHSGILTATNISRYYDAPRAMMMTYFMLMTCSGADGAHVNAHQALAVATPDIRNDAAGQAQMLATAPGCANCHARLEHAMPFFGAWRSAFRSLEIEPEFQPNREAPIYLNNMDDLRGKVKTNPAAFAEVVTAQPEFANCQASRIAKYIFNKTPPHAVNEKLIAMIAARKPARDVMKTALKEYIELSSRDVHASSSQVDPSKLPAKPFDADANRTFKQPLIAAMSVCEDCHGDGDAWIDHAVESHQATALHLLRAADMVASGAMPKNQWIPEADRELVVTKLCEAAWDDETMGRATATVLLGQRRPAQVHEFTTAVGIFGGSPQDEPWKVPELYMKPGFNFLTPGTAASFGLEALRGCREREKTPADVQACIDKLLDDGGYLRME